MRTEKHLGLGETSDRQPASIRMYRDLIQGLDARVYLPIPKVISFESTFPGGPGRLALSIARFHVARQESYNV